MTDDEQVSLQEQGVLVAAALERQEVSDLLRVVKALSTPSSQAPMLPAWRIEQLLIQSGLVIKDPDSESVQRIEATEPQNPFEVEIEWLLVAKAAMQTYGAVLQTLIDQQISLDDHISYWDEVSHSYRHGFVYWVQRTPIRLWSFTRDVYVESKRRIQGLYTPTSEPDHYDLDVDTMSETRNVNGVASISSMSLSQRWAKFYQVVRTTVQDRSLLNIQDQILSPIALCQAEAREKRFAIRRLKENVACGVGTLVDEGLNFTGRGVEWKEVLERSVSLMDTVLAQTPVLDGNVQDFEERIFRFVDSDPGFAMGLDEAAQASAAIGPRKIATRLLRILQAQIPQQTTDATAVIKEHGRPSRWIRYWLPATVGLLSSTTILRMLFNRKDQVTSWVLDLGVTARDFWANWVVEPMRKVIGTIRHDENSEIALMSRDSLRADLESLERMVVDFAVDKPHFAVEGNVASSGLSEAQISDIRAKVSQGDLTPVLKAYEKDLKSPLVGAVRGDLVRSLLIQVQKSKVDMEIALTGIDSLLKSQELVFGFVGLTPGILVSVFVFQYMHGAFLGRSGYRKRNRAVRATHAMRTIGRMLAKADLSNKTLTYEQIGTLLCHAHILRTLVPGGAMPDDTEKDFLADLDELVSSRVVPIQKKLVDDIAFAYQKWIF